MLKKLARIAMKLQESAVDSDVDNSSDMDDDEVCDPTHVFEENENFLKMKYFLIRFGGHAQ